MSKPVKEMITRDVENRFAGVDSACVVNVSGVNAVAANRMRGALKKQNIHMHVVKNSLARRALGNGPLGPLVSGLKGPSALVWGDPAVTDIAKELVNWAKELKTLELKHGIFEADPDLLTVEELARMKGKRELIGEIAMLISSPGRRIAGALQSPAGKIAGCLKAIVEKAEPGEPAA